MKNLTKRVIASLVSVLMLTALVSCGNTKTEETSSAASDAKSSVDVSVNAVNIREKLSAMIVSDKELDLVGKYNSIADIKDGENDSALIGNWSSSDGSIKCTFDENGVMKMESTMLDSASDVKYTCLTLGDRHIICEDLPVETNDDSDDTAESTEVSYVSYVVENDALYLLDIESTTDEGTTSYISSLITLYHADDNGSIDDAIAKNPIDLNSLYGSWTSDNGDVTIDENGLTLDKDTYKLSFDEKNQLVAEKDGNSTVYQMTLGYSKNYKNAEKTEVEDEKYALSLTYTGADENDKPNLVNVMTDWKTEYGWESWYYNTTFFLGK